MQLKLACPKHIKVHKDNNWQPNVKDFVLNFRAFVLDGKLTNFTIKTNVFIQVNLNKEDLCLCSKCNRLIVDEQDH